jgi:integrase
MYQNSGLSGSTVNSALKVVRALFAEAERLGVMYRNPAAKVACFARNGRERGVLTQEELDDLFALDALETVWKGRRVPYLVAMLAVGCGARHGEAVALRAADVGGQTICITRSWNEHAGEFTLPKWKSLREVPAPPRLQAELEQYIHDNNIAGEQLLFPGVDPSRPVDNKKLLDSLRGALAEIGIPPAEQARTRRFLDMHALRHTYVTRLRAGDVPDWQIQRAAGHRSVTMTDRYTHANAGDLKAVAGANILPFKKENVS